MNNIQSGLMTALLALGALASQAGQYWWSGNGTTLGGSGTWDTSLTRWGTSVAGPFNMAWPNDSNDEAVFTNAAGTATLSGAVNVNKLTFDVNSFVITGGTLNLTGSNPTFTKRAGGNGSWEIVASPLSGSGDLTLVGVGAYNGAIHLRANNSAFTGRLVVTNGLELAFTNDFNLGLAPARFTADALIMRGGQLTSGTGSYRPSIHANRGISNINGFTVFTGIALNSAITGSGGITFRSDGLGSVLGSSANDYAGGTALYTDSGASTYLVLGADNALPHGTGKGNLNLTAWSTGTARVDLNGYSVILNGLSTGGSSTYYYTRTIIDNVSAGGTVTLTVGDGDATATYYGQVRNTTGTLNLTKIGTGTQTLFGTNSYSGMTTVNRGTLQADLTTYTNGVISPASSVTLAGGTLNIKGKNSGTSSQVLANLSVNAGGSAVSITPNGGSGTTLTLSNTWTRQTGGTLSVDISAAGSTVTSSPTLQNSILGYALVKDATGTGFATVSGGNVVRYTGATVLDAATAAGNLDGTVNYVVTNNVTLSGPNATQSVNSLRLESQLASGSKTVVVGSGGVVLKSAGWIVHSGIMTSGGSDLILNQIGSEIGISANIVDNGSTPVGLTITGSGSLFIWGANTYSGDTVMNGVQVKQFSAIPFGAGRGNLVVNSGGNFDLGGAAVKINGLASSPMNAGGIVNSSWGAATALTLGHGDASASYSGSIQSATLGLIKVGTGTQTLTGVNSYGNGTILSNGILSVSSLSNIGGANAKVTFAGGTLRISGTAFTSFGTTPLTFTSAGGGVEIADAGNTFTLTNNLGSGTVLTKTGAGTLSLTGTQAGTINTDDPSKISFGAGIGFYNLGVTTNGVLSPAGSGAIGTVAVNNNLALAGKLLADVTGATNDTVTAGGSITLSGATLELVNPSLLNRSKQYQLMAAGDGTVSGTFASSNLPARWKVSVVGYTVVLYYANPGTMIRVL